MEKRMLLNVPGATLMFYIYQLNGIDYIEFDASPCVPPEPMVNAMKGFELIRGTEKRLVMIAFHEPTPLYNHVATDFSWDVEVLDNGNVKIVFKSRSVV